MTIPLTSERVISLFSLRFALVLGLGDVAFFILLPKILGLIFVILENILCKNIENKETGMPTIFTKRNFKKIVVSVDLE